MSVFDDYPFDPKETYVDNPLIGPVLFTEGGYIYEIYDGTFRQSFKYRDVSAARYARDREIGVKCETVAEFMEGINAEV